MANVEPVPICDGKRGVVTFDIPIHIWEGFTVQGRIAFITHQLIDFMATPSFHSRELRAVRFQVREPGIIMPKEVVCHIGEKLIIDQGGTI